MKCGRLRSALLTTEDAVTGRLLTLTIGSADASPNDHATSKRSAFMTFVQAATKSDTNFCCASFDP
jgi:hypothetical protein